MILDRNVAGLLINPIYKGTTISQIFQNICLKNSNHNLVYL